MKRRSYALFFLVAAISLIFYLSGCRFPSDGDGGDSPCPWDDEDDGNSTVDDGDSPCPCDDEDDDGGNDNMPFQNETTTTMDQATAENLMALLLMKGVDDIPVDALMDDFIEDFPIDTIIDNMPVVTIIDDFLDGIPSEMTIDDLIDQITIEDIINWFSTKSPSTLLKNWALDRAKDALLSGTAINRKTGIVASAISKVGSCNSGTYQAEGSWTGPEEPTLKDLCDVSDLELVIGTDNCVINSITANGGIQISVVGNLCSPESMSVELIDFGVHESYSDTQITFNAFNVISDVAFPETYLGDLQATSVLNGDMTVDGVALEFSEVTNDLTVGFTSGIAISFNGDIKGSCIDEWVTVETVSPVTFDIEDDHHCPTGGQINFSGDGEAAADFSSDGGMTVGEATFSSCDELPEACQSEE